VTDREQSFSLVILANNYRQCTIFGRPFVKRFALSYRTVVCLSILSCPCLSVSDVGVLLQKRLDGLRWNLAYK